MASWEKYGSVEQENIEDITQKKKMMRDGVYKEEAENKIIIVFCLIIEQYKKFCLCGLFLFVYLSVFHWIY